MYSDYPDNLTALTDNTEKSLSPKITISKRSFVYHKGNIQNDYAISVNLGKGAFGTVRKAVHKVTGQARAVKILKKSDHDEDKLYLEVDILCKLNHPNIMQIYEYYDDDKNFYIVSELCSGGELIEKITKLGAFSEKDAAFVMKQILGALYYIHSNNVVHRDIKPENIVLDDKSDHPVIKLIDWGGARYFSKDKKMTNILGTAYYMAPEVLNGIYDEKCDIWSCGVVLYILLCGYPPFPGKTNDEVYKAVKIGKYEMPSKDWDRISKDAKDLVSNMLKFNSKDRFSAKDCFDHSWFKKMEKNDIAKKDDSHIVLENMKKFKKYRKLQHATFSFIVLQILSNEERNELIASFNTIDKNHDGVISNEELYEAYLKIYGDERRNQAYREVVR